VVVGDLTQDSPYVNRLRQSRESRLRLIGAIYDAARLRALRFHAKGYFHGHSVGGTNPSLLEAMGSGNAIIAHDNVFNREVAAGAAFYFSNAADLPGVLATMSADPARVQAMRAAARQRVESIYNWNAIADRYQELLRPGPRKPGRMPDPRPLE
jgi:glycosyltransferase involved in cell wall biosynthesis